MVIFAHLKPWNEQVDKTHVRQREALHDIDQKCTDGAVSTSCAPTPRRNGLASNCPNILLRPAEV